MTAIPYLLIIAAGLAALMFVPDGMILDNAIDRYYTGEAVNMPVTLQPYGMVIAAGTLCGILVFLMIRMQKGQYSKSALRQALSFSAGAVCLGFICSRILYCLASLLFYIQNAGAGAIFRWWEGGLSMTGALLGIMISAVITIRNDAESCQAAVPALVITIAAARIAESFGNIGFGMDVEFENWLTAADEFGNVLNVWKIETIMTLVVGAGVLVWLKKDSKCPHGIWFGAAFLVFYCSVQILMESLRADRHMIWGFVKAQQLFSFLIAFMLLLLFSRGRKEKIITTVVSAALAGGVFGLEKALDRLNVPDYWFYLMFVALIAAYLAYAVKVMRRMEKQEY